MMSFEVWKRLPGCFWLCEPYDQLHFFPLRSEDGWEIRFLSLVEKRCLLGNPNLTWSDLLRGTECIGVVNVPEHIVDVVRRHAAYYKEREEWFQNVLASMTTGTRNGPPLSLPPTLTQSAWESEEAELPRLELLDDIYQKAVRAAHALEPQGGGH